MPSVDAMNPATQTATPARATTESVGDPGVTACRSSSNGAGRPSGISSMSGAWSELAGTIGEQAHSVCALLGVGGAGTLTVFRRRHHPRENDVQFMIERA